VLVIIFSLFTISFLVLFVPSVCPPTFLLPAQKTIPIRGDPHVLVVGDPGLGKSQVSSSRENHTNIHAHTGNTDSEFNAAFQVLLSS